MNIYLDDIRNPKTDNEWIIVRTSTEAIRLMEANGCPDFISFDHDLGGDDTAMIVVHWMVEEDLNSNGDFSLMDLLLGCILEVICLIAYLLDLIKAASIDKHKFSYRLECSITGSAMN